MTTYKPFATITFKDGKTLKVSEATTESITKTKEEGNIETVALYDTFSGYSTVLISQIADISQI